MEFDDYYEKKEQLIETFSSQKNVPRVDLAVMVSPYRICPLGAHIDHQGGLACSGPARDNREPGPERKPDRINLVPVLLDRLASL